MENKQLILDSLCSALQLSKETRQILKLWNTKKSVLMSSVSLPPMTEADLVRSMSRLIPGSR